MKRSPPSRKLAAHAVLFADDPSIQYEPDKGWWHVPGPYSGVTFPNSKVEIEAMMFFQQTCLASNEGMEHLINAASLVPSHTENASILRQRAAEASLLRSLAPTSPLSSVELQLALSALNTKGGPWFATCLAHWAVTLRAMGMHPLGPHHAYGLAPREAHPRPVYLWPAGSVGGTDKSSSARTFDSIAYLQDQLDSIAQRIHNAQIILEPARLFFLCNVPPLTNTQLTQLKFGIQVSCLTWKGAVTGTFDITADPTQMPTWTCAIRLAMLIQTHLLPVADRVVQKCVLRLHPSVFPQLCAGIVIAMCSLLVPPSFALNAILRLARQHEFLADQLQLSTPSISEALQKLCAAKPAYVGEKAVDADSWVLSKSPPKITRHQIQKHWETLYSSPVVRTLAALGHAVFSIATLHGSTFEITPQSFLPFLLPHMWADEGGMLAYPTSDPFDNSQAEVRILDAVSTALQQQPTTAFKRTAAMPAMPSSHKAAATAQQGQQGMPTATHSATNPAPTSDLRRTHTRGSLKAVLSTARPAPASSNSEFPSSNLQSINQVSIAAPTTATAASAASALDIIPPDADTGKTFGSSFPIELFIFGITNVEQSDASSFSSMAITQLLDQLQVKASTRDASADFHHAFPTHKNILLDSLRINYPHVFSAEVLDTHIGFFDTRAIGDPSTSQSLRHHIGTFPETMLRLLHSTRHAGNPCPATTATVQRIAKWVHEQGSNLLFPQDSQRPRVIAIYCKSGRHRSVAMAKIVQHCLQSQGMAAVAVTFASKGKLWKSTCGGCNDCLGLTEAAHVAIQTVCEHFYNTWASSISSPISKLPDLKTAGDSSAKRPRLTTDTSTSAPQAAVSSPVAATASTNTQDDYRPASRDKAGSKSSRVAPYLDTSVPRSGSPSSTLVERQSSHRLPGSMNIADLTDASNAENPDIFGPQRTIANSAARASPYRTEVSGCGSSAPISSQQPPARPALPKRIPIQNAYIPRRHSCDYCKKSFVTPKDLDDHMTMTSRQSPHPKYHKDTWSDLTFSQWYARQLGRKGAACQFCSEIFNNKGALLSHHVAFAGSGLHPLIEGTRGTRGTSGAPAETAEAPSAVRPVHDEDIGFGIQCEFCEEFFSEHDEFIIHLLTMQGRLGHPANADAQLFSATETPPPLGTSSSSSGPPAAPPPLPRPPLPGPKGVEKPLGITRPYKCPWCHLFFDSNAALDLHLYVERGKPGPERGMHPADHPVPRSTTEGYWQCDDCGELFYGQAVLIAHRLTAKKFWVNHAPVIYDV